MKKVCSILIFFILVIACCIPTYALSEDLEYNTKQSLYELLNQNVLQGNENIDISHLNISVDQAEILVSDYIWDNPEYTFPIVATNYQSLGNTITNIIFQYDNISTIQQRHQNIL